MTRPFQRQTVFIKRSLQLKYMAIVFASVLLASFLIGGDIYYTVTRLLLRENPGLVASLSHLAPIMAVKLVLYLTLILLVTLYISHRIAGPLHRFEQSARIVAQGDLTHRVSLRASDELTELQEEFNAMVAGLQSLIQKDRTLSQHIRERLESLLENPPAPPALSEALKSLRDEAGQVTGAFKV